MSDIKPILKWAGGKQGLLTELDSVFNNYDISNHNFIDAFVGGGSVFLHVANKKMVINDFNPELINVYKTIKDYPEELIKVLKKHSANHSKEYYYKVRNADRKSSFNNYNDINKAARTIYLNRTCFNGLMRYNKDGYFNVPIGRYKNPNIVMKDRIYQISEYLNSNSISIMCGDFSLIYKKCKPGDLIYFDPPYDYEETGFTDYTKQGWNRNDLNRLKDFCDRLVEKGCHIVLSNNDTKYVNDLFFGYRIKKIKANRFINSNGSNRKKVNEVIIYD